MSEWQPIETAPKDGSHVLLFTKYGIVECFYVPEEVSAEYFDEYGPETFSPFWSGFNDAVEIEIRTNSWAGQENHGPATHWMPLPEPPK